MALFSKSTAQPSLIEITNSAELFEYQFRTCMQFEERFPRFSRNLAEWEESQKYYPRARSIFERALLQRHHDQDPTLWVNYAELLDEVEHQGLASETMKRFHSSKLRDENRNIQYHVNSEFDAWEKRNGGRSIPHLVYSEDRASSRRNKSRHIPHDLMLNILSRVPARSLVRLRCACKLWNSLFHDRYFVKLQLNHSSKNPTAFVACTSNRYFRKLFSFDIEDGKLVCGDKFTVPVGFHEEYEMTNACDGLIAFFGSCFAFMANPSTREWTTLPVGRAKESHDFEKPSVGLGFSIATEKYKLVWIHRWSCDVLTLGTDRIWRPLGQIPYSVDTTFQPEYSNGFIYWTVYGGDSILALNVAQEEFVKIPLPQRHHSKPYRPPDYCYLCMRILEGSLCLIDYRVYHDHERSLYVPFMHIYVLESHSGVEGGDPPVWREKHNLTLSVEVLPCGDDRPLRLAMLPVFIRGGKLLLFREGKSWRLHDILTGACPTIKLPQEESTLFHGWSAPFICAASIVPIDRA